MIAKTSHRFFAIAFMAVGLLIPSYGGGASTSILDSPHNLSVSSTGKVEYSSVRETRVCIFCHTPHHATVDRSVPEYPEVVAPLWSRDLPNVSTYTPYDSPSIKNKPGLPTGSSRLCLSCHDGTIALGVLNGGFLLDAALHSMNHAYDSYLGSDLSTTHPISMSYFDGLSTPEYVDPVTLDKRIKLVENVVECTACHNAHNNQYGNFLVLDNSLGSPLCTACHNKAGWDGSAAHKSGGTFNASVGGIVSANGCGNCHKSHHNETAIDLLKLSKINANPINIGSNPVNSNCILTCHNDSSNYRVNIAAAMTLTYRHDLAPPSTHAVNETFPPPSKHVECVDCHNPHQSGYANVPLGSTLLAPAISDALRGVRGVDSNLQVVNPAIYEYQVCYRCHAGTNGSDVTFLSSLSRPSRVITDYREQNRFNSTISRHPVSELLPRRYAGGTAVYNSLKTSYQNDQKIFCSDCHEPHGSAYPMLFKNSYDVGDGTLNYDLCSRCHNVSTFVMTTASGFTAGGTTALHASHYNKGVACSVCHDPHGISTAAGAATPGANDHLINFDKNRAGLSALYNGSGGPGLRSCGTLAVGCHSVAGPHSY